jgi:hypothetical protein
MDGTMAATANTATKRAARERMDIENSRRIVDGEAAGVAERRRGDDLSRGQRSTTN